MILLPVLAFVIAVAAISFVAYPLVSTSLGRSGSSGMGPADELFARRDRIYTELRELEFDHKVGKVSADDYREIKDRLEVEAARVLRSIDVELKGIDDEIEREVKRLRSKGPICPSCGVSVTKGARFCVHCGAPLQAMAGR